MIELGVLLTFLLVFSALSYHRSSLIIFSLSLVMLAIFFTYSIGFTFLISMIWIILFLVLVPLNILPIRRHFFTRPILNFYRSVMPTMSKTEKEAIAAGTVTWEGELFRGNPKWDKLLSYPKAVLTEEEQAFID